MKLLRAACLYCWIFAAASAGAASLGMQPLSELDLENIAGQDGVALSIDFRINAQADGSAVPAAECPTVAGLTGGASCRLALNFADAAGIWIVMKSYRGILRLSRVYIDASNLPNAWTTHTVGGTVLNPYLGGYDPRNKPAIQLTSGPWATALAGTVANYNIFLNQSAYNDMAVGLNIDRLAGEFDCGAAVNTAAGIHVGGCSGATPGWNGVDRVPGYLRDGTPGAAIGLRMADGISAGNLTPSAPSQMRLDGRLQIFGY